MMNVIQAGTSFNGRVYRARVVMQFGFGALSFTPRLQPGDNAADSEGAEPFQWFTP